MFPYIQQTDQITVVVDGQPHTINEDEFNFKKVINGIRNDDEAEVRRAIVKEHALIDFAPDHVTVKNGVVYWDNMELPAALTTRMTAMVRDGLSPDPLIKFTRNLNGNPSYRAVKELYRFLEKNSLPITSDGCFLAYKKVRDDYTDVYSGKISNKPGNVVKMPRNAVNDDPTQTCSAGLHFCSLEYLKCFTGARTVIVKVNPRDVVSIPIDYNNSKGRTCRYEVVNELGVRPEAAFTKPVQDAPESYVSDNTETVLNNIDNDVDDYESYDYDFDESYFRP